MEFQEMQGRESELTAAIGRPARRALDAQGITDYRQLASKTERELLALHGVGPRAIRILDEELRARDLAFRQP